MKRNMGWWQAAGFAAVSLLGTGLHFLYDLTGNSVTALFSSVNESTWEHMKLLFFPMLLFAIAESLFLGKEYENFWCVKLCGILTGLLLIPVIFYTLNGVFGKTPDFVNISIFFIAAAAAFICETLIFKKGSLTCKFSKSAIALLCLIALCFWVFTFFPPQIPLFQDPTA